MIRRSVEIEAYDIGFYGFWAGMSGLVAPVFGQAIVIDHTCTDLSRIPDSWITQAKSDLHIAYQHTSHGSQLITGINALETNPLFLDGQALQ